jgi:hypothetical protein
MISYTYPYHFNLTPPPQNIVRIGPQFVSVDAEADCWYPIPDKAGEAYATTRGTMRVKEQGAENSQLKRMYANLALEDEAVKAVLKKL